MPIACITTSMAQQKVGINTTSPVRQLDIYGSGQQYLRIHTETPTFSIASLELLRGSIAGGARDWRISNHNGNLLFTTSSENFTGVNSNSLIVNSNLNIGLGTPDPLTKLHVDDGEETSLTGDGLVLIGSKSGLNLSLDTDEIQVRNNGASASLYLQSNGGNTWFGDGNVFIGDTDGNWAINSTATDARINVEGTDWQLRLRNNLDGTNDWYIGASEDDWLTGDNHLLFSPSTSSSSATLRLYNTNDNDGILAPVMINAPSSNRLLLDGNEIDTYSTSLFLNSNSEEELYINPNGGRVGIGMSSPQAKLHVRSSSYALALSENLITWWIMPTTASNLNFYRITNLLGYISYSGGGDWVAVSDRNLKTSIQPFAGALSKIRQLEMVRYRLTYDPSGTPDIGVIAQQVQPIFPEAVGGNDDQLTVSYDQLTVIALSGLQEQYAQIQNLLQRADSLLDDYKTK